jgi:N-acetylglutamate synthase-like GNAT family acetyltransferase
VKNTLVLRGADLQGDILDNSVALSLAPLVGVYPENPDFIIALCAESISFIEKDIATFFLIREDNKSLAAACVIDPFGDIFGCYHLHHIGVFKSLQGNKLGSALMDHIKTFVNGIPITLESSIKSKLFFEKHGFQAFDDMTSTGLHAMYNKKPKNNQFCKLNLSDIENDNYIKRAYAALKKYKIVTED